MRIIIKFIIKNIKEKKFRTFLILFSITLSAALFFASLAISSTVEEMQVERLKKYFGTAEIIIHANQNSPAKFFRSSRAKKIRDDLEYVVGSVRDNATYKFSQQDRVDISLHGYQLEQLQVMNPIIIKEKYNLAPFVGKKTIISEWAAKKYDLKAGNKIDLIINGHKYRFLVVGIASAQGLFRPEGNNITAVVPKEKLATLYDARGRSSILYLKTKDSRQIKSLIEKLSQQYRRYTVRKTITREEIREHTKATTMPFMLMLILVVFISVFIIYTAFKVIAMERLPVIGTFRSVGATKMMTDFILLVESLVYGVIGGVLGCILGFGILYLMTQQMANNPWTETKLHAEMIFSTGQLLTAFGGAVILSILSSLIPIIKVSKIPVKDIVLNKIDTKSKNKKWKLVLGILLLMLGLGVPIFVPINKGMPVYITALILLGIAIVILVPYVTNLFILLLERVYNYIFGNIGVLAVKNLRDNKSIVNNIALLAIGIASILMINTVSSSVATEVLNYYGDAKYQIEIHHSRANRRVEGRIRAIRGVKDTYGIYRSFNVELANSDYQIGGIHGIDVEQFFDYWELDIIGDRARILKELPQERSIILGTAVKEKLNCQVGDKITLETKHGNRDYKIIAFANTLFFNGDAAFVADKFLKLDMELKYLSELYVKTYQDPIAINQEIKEKFSRDSIWSMTMEEMEVKNMKSNNQLFVLLKGFSLVTMIIGIFGVFNNFVVSFISRKRTLAILRSVGISKQQTLVMILLESLTGGLIGGIVGVLGGYSFVIIVEYVLKAINLSLPMHYSWSMMIKAIGSGMLISVIAVISPAIRSSKLNIIEAIKYE